jgi:hypothetical protein
VYTYGFRGRVVVHYLKNLIHRSWEEQHEKQSDVSLPWRRWRTTRRRGEELTLGLLGLGWHLHPGRRQRRGRMERLWSQEKRIEGGRERNDRKGVTGNRGAGGNGVGTPSQAARGRAGAWPSSPHAWTRRQWRKRRREDF